MKVFEARLKVTQCLAAVGKIDVVLPWPGFGVEALKLRI